MTKKVIIIDDSLISLNLTKTVFASSGWEVYSTQYASDALKMIYDIAPDLIITDALMPVMGGFQFLKELRNNPKTDKIPVIIYSILDDKNSKYYIKNERAEYYLKKTDNSDELLLLADDVINKHPLSDEYKYEILKTNIELSDILETPPEADFESSFPVVEFEKLEAEFKEKYDFLRSDNIILSDVFNILYPLLRYELAVICIHSFEKNEKVVYFDIKDIILSPILQNNILHEMKTKNSFLFKKYAPNLKVITNEEEFLTKIRFDFDYNEADIGNIIFYSREKSKWLNNPNIETIRSVLANFFRARFINKSSRISKTNDISNKYFMDKLDFKFDLQSDKQMYCAIIEVVNYKELQDNLSMDDLDYVNSKISEKLISFISNEEQLFKNDKDEYSIVFYAKDEAHANQKLGWIVDLINEIELDDNKIDIYIGTANCKIDGQYNFYEARNNAREALDWANSQNRIVIYGAK